MSKQDHTRQIYQDQPKEIPHASSRIAGFAKMTPKERTKALLQHQVILPEDISILNQSGSLTLELADRFIENCIGGFTIPLGIATNFVIDGKDIFIPMAVEESSVVAAASYGAKLARSNGGFFSKPTETIATCQVQFFVEPDMHPNDFWTPGVQNQILHIAKSKSQNLIARGGGPKSIELRSLSKAGYHVLHINVNTCEAMGANVVNTIAEEVGQQLPFLFECSVGSKILTNLTIHRLTRVSCQIDLDLLAKADFTGLEAAKRICQVWEFADLDPFRAATHNKGIMNGIDPVVIATGNDWRAVEAGCHAYASLSGQYKPLTKWFINEQNKLQGDIELPIAVGTVGGVTKLHPSAMACLNILNHPSAAELSTIIASVGLAQNLSALRALGCEGIQKGHMALHEKNLEMMKQYDHIPSISIVDTKP